MSSASSLPTSISIRLIRREDYEQWIPLWEGYNAFYGRSGDTALDPEITAVTWWRFFNPIEPVFAVVAETEEVVVGFAHFLFHRSTTRLEPVCYLNDIFTLSAFRGRGIGKSLIHGVYEYARNAGARRVYWQTQAANEAGRALYDKVAMNSGFIVYSHQC
ncbi:GNAT family N-acetyltransferase [Variovorax terrae]|uniref:GNAT family N-acetyltransferase n=1 Tax=Variovorax terrae TaxID=2923278 RepID=A0A9X1W1M4_9BURK|nr:GNAT family N-acetyltransferase [Variovorax terrae]MCJ0766154.1 GNAT family N-acetyltransferase [Variovorax terrae]